MKDNIKKYLKILENIESNQYDPNMKGYNNNTLIGFYGQNQEKVDNREVFDYRKKLEFSYDKDINEKNRADHYYVNAENLRDNVYDEIANWLYEKNLYDSNDLAKSFEKIYWFILNNTQEIYEVFGKSLDDEERKIVLLKTLDKINNKLKDKLISNIVKNPSVDLVEFIIKNGLTLNEAYSKIMERAPKNPKAEEFIKKSKKEFKKRYGDRWKEVLYATAWKKFGESEEYLNNEEVKEEKNISSLLRKRRDSKYLKIRKLKKLLSPLFKPKRKK